MLALISVQVDADAAHPWCPIYFLRVCYPVGASTVIIKHHPTIVVILYHVHMHSVLLWLSFRCVSKCSIVQDCYKVSWDVPVELGGGLGVQDVLGHSLAILTKV